VVPALNEEQAIAGTLRRALAAREKVQAQTPVDEMIVVFVNDGSTDRTQEIVEQPEFDEVVKIRFEKNRGYGAAIKAGWQATDAELVGFIDGDGTCNPDFCINLVNEMLEHDADAVLAGRLDPDTQMPLIRKIGNRLFAWLLGLVSGAELTDSASGFRIVRRSSLKLMSPLPDGLHFTPAMSCICLLDPRLKIHEVHGMGYREREGRSKLSVVRDGVRFLWTILFSACVYSPIKTMLAASAIGAVTLGLVMLVLALLGMPAWVEATLGLMGALMIVLAVATGVVTHQLNYLLIGPRIEVGPLERLLQRMLYYRGLIGGGVATMVLGLAALIALGFAGVGDSLGGYIGLLATLLITVIGGTMALGGVVVRAIWAVHEKQKALLHDQYEVMQPVPGGQTVLLPEPPKERDQLGVVTGATPLPR
jgi:hypothetical protein